MAAFVAHFFREGTVSPVIQFPTVLPFCSSPVISHNFYLLFVRSFVHISGIENEPMPSSYKTHYHTFIHLHSELWLPVRMINTPTP